MSAIGLPPSNLSWARRRRRSYTPSNSRRLFIPQNYSFIMDVPSSYFPSLSSPAPLVYVFASLLLVPPPSSRAQTSDTTTDKTPSASTANSTASSNKLLDPPADHDPYIEFGTRARTSAPLDSLGPRARSTPSYNLANATMAVVIGTGFMSLPKGQPKVLEGVKTFLETRKTKILQHGGLNVEYYSHTEVKLQEDLTAVLSVANCEDTWRLYEQVRREVLFFAITEADCPRLPVSTAITVPMSDNGGDLPQMILDLKTSRTIAWKYVTVLHDFSIGVELLDRVLRALSWESVSTEGTDAFNSTTNNNNQAESPGGGSVSTAISVFHVANDVTDWKRRHGIEHVLLSIPRYKVDSYFLVLVRYNLVGLIMDVAKDRGMVHPRAQWLYIISDTDSSRDSVTSFAPLLDEGQNVAFASNVTQRHTTCNSGVLCHCDEILFSFLTALDQSVRDEQDLSMQVSEEEWEAIRPTKEERMKHMLKHIHAMLRETGRCDNCTAWHMRSADTWGLSYAVDASNTEHSQTTERSPTKKYRAHPRRDHERDTSSKAAQVCDPSSSRNCSDFSSSDTDIPTVQRSSFWPRHSRRYRRVSKKDRRKGDKDKDHGDDNDYYDYDEDDEKEDTTVTTTTARPAKRRERRPPLKGRLISVGWWRPREGLILQDKLFPHISHGFRNRTLPFITVHNPPWQIISMNESGHLMSYKGLVFEIINELSKNLNFTYTVTFPTDESFTNDSAYYYYKLKGANDPTNTNLQNISWNKMIDMVHKNKMFLGAAGFTVTTERKRMVNFTYPISIQRYNFLVVRPRELSRALLFMSPFTSETWACIAISVLAVGPVLNYFHRSSPFYEYFGTRTKGGLNTVTNCLWYAYGALLQQGGAYLPDADSGRLVVGTWWLVVLVLVTTYCGNLVAALTFPRMEKSIHTLEELLESADKGITWGFLANSPLHDHLKTTNDPRLTSLLKGARIHQQQDQELLDSVRSGTHVFIDWRINLLYLMKKDFLVKKGCDFSLEPADFLEEQVAMIMTQGSPYLSLINEEVRRMHQVGLIQKWLVDYLPKKDRCWVTSSVQEANNHSVNLEDMQGSFFVLFLGFIFSACLIFVECIWKRHKTSKEKHVIKPFVA